MYIELLKKYKEQYGFKLFSFALLPDELNLLIELKDGTTISAVMHDINSAYTKYFNASHQRRGHLFRERFKSVIVEKEPYLLSLIRYLHLKPVKMGLVKTHLDYTFSSNLLYLYNTGSQAETSENLRNILNLDSEIQEVMEVIGKVFPEKKSYADFISQVSREEMEGLENKLRRSGLLGSEEFIENVKEQMENRKTEAREEKKSLHPAILFSAVILLGGAAIGVIYVQKNISSKEKEIFQAQKQTLKHPEPEEKVEAALKDLNNTEWTIELKASSKSAAIISYLDEIQFKDGKINSRSLKAEGYLPSVYKFSALEDGTLVWETMQRNPSGDTVFWRGEEKEGKMSGIFSKHPAAGTAQDFSFTSMRYRRKE